MVNGGGGGGDDGSGEEEQSGSESNTASEEDASDTQSEASSASWGSDDMDVDDEGDEDDDGGGGGSTSAARKKAAGDDDTAVAARRLAAETGARTGRWAAPDVADETTMTLWEAKEGSANSEWAFHIQTSGARQHRRTSQMPTSFKWTGDLRPDLVSPRRRVPSVGWLAPPPDYARSGWPEAEFASPLQHKLEVKTAAQLAKMKAACRLGRAVMDAVAAALQPGVTTDALDRICHVMTVMNGAYPSPRNYMGFPKSLCTSVGLCTAVKFRA
jgi:DNA-directed RNA polymerase specialized sigma24 family protein